ncbi:SLATT domain-containing protein [Bradyrhizobium sp. 1.29L]
MADTSERPPSKVRDEIILEAQRIEERTRDSSKGHHCAAEGWNKRAFRLGLPTAIISAVTSLAVFAQAAKDYWWIGLIAITLSITVTILTTLATFLKPEEKQSAHFNAAIAYDKLNGEARMFWSFECWRSNATEEVLTARIMELTERKDKLNQDSPQIPPWAWKEAKARIDKGETDFAVDRVNRNGPTPAIAPAAEPVALSAPAEPVVEANSVAADRPAG